MNQQTYTAYEQAVLDEAVKRTQEVALKYIIGSPMHYTTEAYIEEVMINQGMKIAEMKWVNGQLYVKAYPNASTITISIEKPQEYFEIDT